MISEWLSPQIRRAARSRRRGGWRSRQSLSGPSRSQLDPRHALVPEQEVQHLEALGAECARVVSGSTGVLMQDDSRARVVSGSTGVLMQDDSRARSEHQGFETSGKRAQERRCNAPKRQAATRAVGHARAVQQEGPSSLVAHLKSKVLSAKRSQSNQRPSEAICDHQRPSEVIRGYQRSSEVIRGHQCPSEAMHIRGHQRPSHLRVISGHQWSSEAISPARHQWSSDSSVVISGHQWPSHLRGVAWTKRKSPGSHPNMDTARPPVRASETVVTSSAAEASASIIIS